MNTFTAVLESEVVLRDGASVLVRSVKPTDETALLDLYKALSPLARMRRFFGAVGEEFLQQEAKRQANLPEDKGFGLIALAGARGRIIGHAACYFMAAHRAEIAFVISDAWQGHGLGTIMLGQLAERACAAGVAELTAIVLPSNHQMIEVFRDSGFQIRLRAEPDQIVVEFPPEITKDARARFEEREWQAVAAAVEGFLKPKRVALVGASRHRGTIGGELFHNLLSFGFTGAVLPINAHAPVVQGVLAYPSLDAAPGDIDLAVIAVPAADVLQVVEQCERKGVHHIVVISAGFQETGAEGAARQQQLVQRCRAAGIRLIGPNCMGIVNTAESVRLNATFAPTPPQAGRVAFMSQSGALGLAIMDYASRIGVGISTFASVGNKADISGNDLLRYWSRDDSVDLILLYLESFGNPRKFARIAQQVSRTKPIVVVKSGRSTAGVRAASSHTGALLAAADTTVDALLHQAGVIRTDTLEQLFDVASLLAHQAPPKGKRVAILTNAGGPGILCADACAAAGLEVPVLGDETRRQLRTLLVPESSVENPVDMVAAASAEQFRQAIEIVGRDDAIDSLIVIYVPPLATGADAVARAIVAGAATLDHVKPLLTVFMQSHGLPSGLQSDNVKIPSYRFPESAALALAKVARYGEWRARPPTRLPQLDVRTAEAAAIIAHALGRGDEWLSPAETWRLLGCYGLPVVQQRVYSTVEEIDTAAAELTGNLALKAHGANLLHKTDVGAVELGLTAETVAAAARGMDARLRTQGQPPSSYAIQSMASEGIPMIVGAVQDAQFGPVLACGAGGTLVEIMNDVSVRLAPVSEDEAGAMVRDLKSHALLTGYRGGSARDLDALIDVIVRVGVMADELPQIAELDLNPVLVHTQGASIVDARIRIAAPPPSIPLGSR